MSLHRARGGMAASLGLGALALAPAHAHGAELLFSDDFAHANGPNSLITNQQALWSDDPAVVRSPNWEMTSGSLFSRAGLGWSGVPDGVVPDATSSNGTGSLVFRLRTVRDDFPDVRQNVSVRIDSFVPLSQGTGWDGVVLWPRYKSEFSLYFAYLLRRDGRVQLTKKCAGDVPGGEFHNGGTYFPLTPVQNPQLPTEAGHWYRLSTEVRDNADGSVTVTGLRDGTVLVRATDDGIGCAPLRGPGRLGVRGDNTELDIDAYRVTKLPAAGDSIEP
jgi:hypothetical protein